MSYTTCNTCGGMCFHSEQLGLMRKMVSTWYERYTDLIQGIEDFAKYSLKPDNPFACFKNQRPHPMDFDTYDTYQDRIACG